MKTLLIFLFVAVVIGELVFQIPKAIQKQQYIDCLKWKKYEQLYPLYETSTSTAELCKTLGVNVWEFVD